MFKKLLCLIARKGPFCVQCRYRKFIRTPLNVLTKSEVGLSSALKISPEPTSSPPRAKTRGNDVRNLEETDEKFLKVMSLLKNKKTKKDSKIILEGRRLIFDAIEAGVSAEQIYFTSDETLKGIPLRKSTNEVELLKITQKKMQVWSDLTTCPGIMGIFKKPDPDKIMSYHYSDFPVSVICDNVREPGNMGSVLRCAAAVGCNKVYVTKGCVDVWEPKVLRTACGAHFRVPIVMLSWEDIENYLPSEMPVYLADHCLETESISGDEGIHKNYDVNVPSHVYSEIAFGDCNLALVIGGETEGISTSAQELALKRSGVRVFIPMENNVNSLNSAMALSIILYEIKRQHQNFTDKCTGNL